MTTRTSLMSLALSLFFLMDPIGNVPVFVSLLKQLPPKRQKVIIIRELFIALATIVLFAFIGDNLLQILQVDQSTVSVAGGVILFLIALRMIFPQPKKEVEKFGKENEPLIVPLAIPLIAGPSVLAAVMIFSHEGENRATLLGSIGLAWLASLVILYSSVFLQKILGQRGITAIERLMGFIVALISLQMLLRGLKEVIAS